MEDDHAQGFKLQVDRISATANDVVGPRGLVSDCQTRHLLQHQLAFFSSGPQPSRPRFSRR